MTGALALLALLTAMESAPSRVQPGDEVRISWAPPRVNDATVEHVRGRVVRLSSTQLALQAGDTFLELDARDIVQIEALRHGHVAKRTGRWAMVSGALGTLAAVGLHCHDNVADGFCLTSGEGAAVAVGAAAAGGLVGFATANDTWVRVTLPE